MTFHQASLMYAVDPKTDQALLYLSQTGSQCLQSTKVDAALKLVADDWVVAVWRAAIQAAEERTGGWEGVDDFPAAREEKGFLPVGRARPQPKEYVCEPPEHFWFSVWEAGGKAGSDASAFGHEKAWGIEGTGAEGTSGGGSSKPAVASF